MKTLLNEALEYWPRVRTAISGGAGTCAEIAQGCGISLGKACRYVPIFHARGWLAISGHVTSTTDKSRRKLAQYQLVEKANL